MKNNLKTLRTELDLTQQDLAEMIGTKKQYICSLETGVRNLATVRTDTIQKLCSALNCSVEELFYNETEFEFENGKLIIDELFFINNINIIQIKDNFFIAPSITKYSAEKGNKNITDFLKLYKGKLDTKTAYRSPMEIFAPFLDCVPRKGYDVEIKRPITKEEFEEFKKKYDIKDKNISTPFVDRQGKIYGEKYEKTYTVVQINFGDRNVNPLDISKELTNKDIEAYAVNYNKMNIRVEENE